MVHTINKSNRITELMDVLEEIEGKAIIWANYQKDIKNIIKAISKRIWSRIRG